MPKPTFFNLDQQKRDAITAAALEEFASQTYNEASVNRIVEKSGISKGSLYQYFEDKKDLYLYLIEVCGQKKLSYLQQQPRAVFEDFFEGFKTMMLQGTVFSLQHPLHSKLLYSAFHGPLIDESMAKMKQMNTIFMQDLLTDAIKKQQIRPDAQIDMMVFFLGTLTTEFARYLALISGVETVGDIYGQNELIEKLDIPAMISELLKLIKSGLEPVK